jgi:ATP-binding cassette subfamily B protein
MFTELKNPKIFTIDFNKPWWMPIFRKKWAFFLILIATGLLQAFWSITPFLAAYLFESKSIFVCFIIFVAWIFFEALHAYTRHLNAQFQLECLHSIYQNAHLHLLVVDPKYHVHRSSGAILAKIDRGARGYEDLLDYITYEFVPLIVGFITIVIALTQYSFYLAIAMSAFILFMFWIGYNFAMYGCQPWEKGFIKSDDAFKTTALENLAQVHLIRSTFSTDLRYEKLQKNVENNMKSEGKLWLSYINIFTILNIMYIFSLFALALFLLWQINHGITTVVSAIGLFVAYIQSSKSVTSFIKILRKFMRSFTAIKDLFEFIPSFGKKGFPVIQEEKQVVLHKKCITIEAHNIYFDYGKAALFNDHLFSLQCSQDQQNKLYGIIGPSGSGKSTLLSILGGQLKPIEGSVIINDIDIYAVGDSVRRQLIALQGQIATNMYGSVKSNLLLGIPENHSFSDQELLKILERVGLRVVLDSHEGLATLLGEGGLNLSGGQRQRLNFAGLYLRARYYNPSVILIDEPTSSLDEISESAITQMIFELSKSAATFVIAHRLKTIEHAIGLIDLSLLPYQKSIEVFSSDQLIKKSHYYQELLQGKVQLDS